MCYFSNAKCLFSSYPTLQVPLAPLTETVLLKKLKEMGEVLTVYSYCFMAKVVCQAAAL